MKRVLELARTTAPGDPYAWRAGRQDYLMRAEGGEYGGASLDWDQALFEDLAALRRASPELERVQQVGRRLQAFLEPSGWPAQEREIVAALRAGEPVHLEIRCAAAELSALPWELMPLSTGQRLGEQEGLHLRYAWPGAQPAPLGAPGQGILLAWADAGGPVAAAEHQEALQGLDARVVERASLASLDAAMRAPPSALWLLAHGAPAGDSFGVVLHDGEGSVVIDGPRLASWIQPYTASVRLVLLSVCQSGDPGRVGSQVGSLAQALHRAGVEAVVAPRFPLPILASVRLGEALLGGVYGRGLAVHEAVAEARSRALLARPTQLDHATIQLTAAPADVRPAALAPYPAGRPAGPEDQAWVDALGGVLQLDALRAERLDPELLRRVVEVPTARAGLAMDAGLVEEVLEEIDHHELALLVELMRALWERREGRRLTHMALNEMGGAVGLLRARAAQVEPGQLRLMAALLPGPAPEAALAPRGEAERAQFELALGALRQAGLVHRAGERLRLERRLWGWPPLVEAHAEAPPPRWRPRPARLAAAALLPLALLAWGRAEAFEQRYVQPWLSRVMLGDVRLDDVAVVGLRLPAEDAQAARAALPELLRLAAEGGATAIGVDLLFSECDPSTPRDAALVAALRAPEPPIVVAAIERADERKPCAALRESGRWFGRVELEIPHGATALSGLTRGQVQRFGEGPLGLSLAAQLARLHREAEDVRQEGDVLYIGAGTVPLTPEGLLVAPPGPERPLGLVEVDVDGSVQVEPPSLFEDMQDRVVLFGRWDEGVDMVNTPQHPEGLHGLALQATLTQALLDGRGEAPVSGWVAALLTLLSAAGALGLGVLRRPLSALAAPAVLALTLGLAATGHMLLLLPLLLAVALGAFASRSAPPLPRRWIPLALLGLGLPLNAQAADCEAALRNTPGSGTYACVVWVEEARGQGAGLIWRHNADPTDTVERAWVEDGAGRGGGRCAKWDKGERPLKPGSVLKEGEVICTEKARAKLVLDTGGELWVQRGSAVEVEDAGWFYQYQGWVAYLIREREPKVTTEHGQAAAEGTRFAVEAAPKKTRVTLAEGVVKVKAEGPCAGSGRQTLDGLQGTELAKGCASEPESWTRDALGRPRDDVEVLQVDVRDGETGETETVGLNIGDLERLRYLVYFENTPFTTGGALAAYPRGHQRLDLRAGAFLGYFWDSVGPGVMLSGVVGTELRPWPRLSFGVDTGVHFGGNQAIDHSRYGWEASTYARLFSPQALGPGPSIGRAGRWPWREDSGYYALGLQLRASESGQSLRDASFGAYVDFGGVGLFNPRVVGNRGLRVGAMMDPALGPWVFMEVRLMQLGVVLF